MVKDCPVRCRMFYSIPHLYLLDAAITSPNPVMTIKNVTRCAKRSFGTNLLPVENHLFNSP